MHVFHQKSSPLCSGWIIHAALKCLGSNKSNIRNETQMERLYKSFISWESLGAFSVSAGSIKQQVLPKDGQRRFVSRDQTGGFINPKLKTDGL